LNQDYSTEWVGIVAGIFTAASLLPQLIKLMRQKKAEDISLFFLIILFCGLGLWIWYGILRNDIPIIATNAFSLLVNTLMIVLGIKYKAKNRAQKNESNTGD
jgi:MtN3 and saliva related transmembrane protein